MTVNGAPASLCHIAEVRYSTLGGDNVQWASRE